MKFSLVAEGFQEETKPVVVSLWLRKERVKRSERIEEKSLGSIVVYTRRSWKQMKAFPFASDEQ